MVTAHSARKYLTFSQDQATGLPTTETWSGSVSCRTYGGSSVEEPGSPLTAVHQSSDRSALVAVACSTPEEAVRRAQEAIEMLTFIYAWNADGGPRMTRS